MSPEQITAGRLPLDHRTDIYSLGATLYELLTLQPPFPGQQRDQVLSQVIHKDPVTPRSINPRIPKDLETICMKSLEKDPDRRYQTAEQLAEDLRRFVNRHAISARRVGPLEKGIRWVRKNKSISASVCAILLVLLGVGTLESWRSRIEQRDNAIEAARKAVFNVDPDQAQAHLKRAMELGMASEDAELLISQVHLMEGKTDEAIAILDRLQNKPDSRLSQVVIASILAQAYSGSGRWGEYRKTVIPLLTCRPATDEERFRLGGALIFVAPGRSLELIETACREKSGYAEAWTTRAFANVFLSIAEPGGNLDRIKEAEFCLRTAQNISGNEETASYVYFRLSCRLTAAHLHRMKGGPDDPTAAEYLKLAEEDVEILARKPNYYVANLVRMYYYDLTDDFDGMNDVMDDIIQYQHRGWLTDPFWAACFQRKEYDLALQKLRALPQDDEYVIDAIARFTLYTATSREEINRIYKEESEKLPITSPMKALLLFGKLDEARKHYKWLRYISALAPGPNDLIPILPTTKRAGRTGSLPNQSLPATR